MPPPENTKARLERFLFGGGLTVILGVLLTLTKWNLDSSKLGKSGNPLACKNYAIKSVIDLTALILSISNAVKPLPEIGRNVRSITKL